jgi:D-alanyl-lipoteichoic acid acyltransferase DltB (MBOAT superfamily)
MLFNSVDFMLFFPVVIGIYFIIPKRLRVFWLLVASYYFYMSWNVKYVVLIRRIYNLSATAHSKK